MAVPKADSVEEQMARLREWFPKGSTVYTILRHVSRSGMMRTIGIVALLVRDGKTDIRHPNYATATVLGIPRDEKSDGVRVRGCGMDMGFHVAYELSHRLYGDGYALSHSWL